MNQILRTRKESDGSFTHFLHYMGWNNRWDEWVRAGDLLKDTEENREKKARLDGEAEQRKAARNRAKRRHGGALKGQAKRQRKEGSAAASGGSGEAPAGPDGAEAGDGEEAEAEDSGLALVVPLPLQLKKQLVDDWEVRAWGHACMRAVGQRPALAPAPARPRSW